VLAVVPLDRAHLGAAARIFAGRLRGLRRRVPSLPTRLTELDASLDLLQEELDPDRTLVALDDDTVVGYLGWREYADFRSTRRRGAHSPEFGNAALAGRGAQVWRALYPVAASRWFSAGCQFHAVTCLAGDPALERALSESGFGLLLHDALRPMTPIDASSVRGMSVRPASARDAPALAELEVEHRRHYGTPPTLMVAPDPDPESDLRRLMATAPGGIWVAESDGAPQGFLRFEPESFGAVVISLAPTTISITGAYVRPAWRGRGAARAMLAAAVEHYRQLGFERLAVDYETINPEALAFWPREFRPVAISHLRVPERG
jgi:ribosomal protein S18 acetylase RimI-like enzyme